MAKFRSQTTDGVSPHLKREHDRIGRTPTVVVKTSGGVRSEVRNIIAVRANAKLGRVFHYVNAAELRKLNEAISEPLKDGAAMSAVGEMAGKHLVATFRKHLESGQIRGSKQQLDPEYARRKHGTLMHETGELARSLRFDVEVGGE